MESSSSFLVSQLPTKFTSLALHGRPGRSHRKAQVGSCALFFNRGEVVNQPYICQTNYSSSLRSCKTEKHCLKTLMIKHKSHLCVACPSFHLLRPIVVCQAVMGLLLPPWGQIYALSVLQDYAPTQTAECLILTPGRDNNPHSNKKSTTMHTMSGWINEV